MALLAKNVQEMQQSLVKTVSVVRDGADTIYTGAGEISAGSNDLSSRTEQQAASLGRDGSQHGAIDCHGETKRRQRPSGNATGAECVRYR